jgi:tetratricopeptide (TPR) repeat protein
MFDQHQHQTTELRQEHSGSGDNVAGDKNIHIHLSKSPEYKQLCDDINDEKELLSGIAPDRLYLRKKHVAKLNDLSKRLNDFKADVFRLYELFTRTPINTERQRLAKVLFDKGEFREADAVLKTEEINAEVVQLKARKAAVLETVAALDQDLADRANEFVLKAHLSQLTPLEGETSRFQRTEQLFEQALAVARTTEALHDYALFLYRHQAFRRAEPLCQEALQLYRSLAVENPEAFLPYLAATLNNLALLHKAISNFGPASTEFEEALKLYRRLAKTNSEAFLPYLAATLNNLANLHKETRDFRQSLAKFKETLKLYRRLAKKNSEAFLPYLAATLNNLANLYQERKTFRPALAVFEKALNIWRGLAAANPEAFLPDVAMILNNLSIFYLQDVPDQKQSVAYAQEARSILIPLCAKIPHLQGLLDQAEALLKANAKRSKQ